MNDIDNLTGDSLLGEGPFLAITNYQSSGDKRSWVETSLPDLDEATIRQAVAMQHNSDDGMILNAVLALAAIQESE